MRRISLEKDYYQPIIIFALIFLYFKFASSLRKNIYPTTIIYFFFIFNFFLSILFFYLISRLLGKNSRKIFFSSYLFTFSYSLLPTIIWFISTSFLYLVLPPPRTFSILGKGFSLFFIIYSLSLFFWKLILEYLALRFSSKETFFKIIYMMILYLAWFIPYSTLLYWLKLFRIPFI